MLHAILITHNRRKHLEATFDQICTSPLNKYKFTLLDNSSDENIDDLVIKYSPYFTKFSYKQNKYNIGGNANIIRAFELSEEKYTWVLCDDDDLDFVAFNEVEEILYKEDNALIRLGYDCAEYNRPSYKHINLLLSERKIIQSFLFLPNLIWPTSIVKNSIIHAYDAIYDSFPHAALLNEWHKTSKRMIYTVSRPVILERAKPKEIKNISRVTWTRYFVETAYSLQIPVTKRKIFREINESSKYRLFFLKMHVLAIRDILENKFDPKEYFIIMFRYLYITELCKNILYCVRTIFKIFFKILHSDVPKIFKRPL